MKLFDTLKNIWKIDELKNRILMTLGLITDLEQRWYYRVSTLPD